tara:strand:- start:29 stop:727 length:699 start_codon:yes stop_codon:yes gene_type:complete
MAHEFVILDTSGVTKTYNDFDDIPQDTILAVIKAFFDPSLIGTKVEGFEILLESATFDEDRVETFCFEDKLPSDGNLLAETGDFLVQESNGDNILVSMVEQFQTFTPLDGSETSFTFNPISDAELGDTIVLDGTDSFGADAGGALLVENYKDGRHRLALENYPTDHLVLEEADETEINQPFLHFNPVASVEADDLNHHTEEEHRELAKLQYQLLSLNNKALENKDVFKTLGQ